MVLQINLSKTDFTKGKQYTKALWLDYHEPELKPDLDDKTKNTLEIEIRIGDFQEIGLNKIVTNDNKLGRNDLCHCKSGKKYKKCCLLTN